MADDNTKGTEMEPQGEAVETTADASEKETYSSDEVKDLVSTVRNTRRERDAKDKELKEARARLAQLESVDPELHAKLVAESAKRAELEAETAARVQTIEKTYSEQLAAAKQEQENAAKQVQQLQKQWAFEKAFTEAGGRAGRFTELAFRELGDQVQLQDDGTLAVVDKAGAFVLDDGKRVKPSEWLKQFKNDEVVGYWFQPERGAGAGLTPQPGTALANGADMHSLSTSELYAQSFGRTKL